MTKTELGNIDALKAIKEQLENQDKTTTVEANVGEQESTKEITMNNPLILIDEIETIAVR